MRTNSITLSDLRANNILRLANNILRTRIRRLFLKLLRRTFSFHINLLIRVLSKMVDNASYRRVSPPSHTVVQRFVKDLSVTQQETSLTASSSAPPVSGVAQPKHAFTVRGSKTPLPRPVQTPDKYLIDKQSKGVIVRAQPPHLV